MTPLQIKHTLITQGAVLLQLAPGRPRPTTFGGEIFSRPAATQRRYQRWAQRRRLPFSICSEYDKAAETLLLYTRPRGKRA